MAASRLDLAILREIVRIVQEKARVPEKVRILKRQFLLIYLEDHRQRMEEALRRFDMDRVNMLFGQLASKVKYQLIRESKRPVAVPKRAVAKVKAVAKAAPKTVVRAKPTSKPAAKAAAKPVLKKKTDKTPKRAAKVKRTSRPQTASRPKRATTATSQRASGGRAAAARKPKPKKRAHR